MVRRVGTGLLAALDGGCRVHWRAQRGANNNLVVACYARLRSSRWAHQRYPIKKIHRYHTSSRLFALRLSQKIHGRKLAQTKGQQCPKKSSARSKMGKYGPKTVVFYHLALG
jgi:hypothetical protein